jgi:hypothetical protein
LKLREITKELIAVLEEKSGCAVHVMENAGLSTLSEIKIARGSLPAHIISYRPVNKTEAPDYAIIFQCALAIRLFDCPPEDRKLIAVSPSGSDALQAILTRPNGFAEKYQLSSANLEGFKDQLLHGLITHLRSIPLGLRVSEKLSLEYPELLDLEAAHVEQELQINKETLTDQIRAAMPQEVFNPTQSINAAFAAFWAERLEQPGIVNPYRLAGFESRGSELLKICDDIPNDPANDCELIDRWADHLQIRGWYTWLPYQTP